MSNEQHPIIPPPELVREWAQINGEKDLERFWMRLATQAARWGADQELEACCEWLKAKEWIHPEFSDELRDARRPKPPSLKQQALEALSRLNSGSLCANPVTDKATIRRALEALDD